MDQVVGRTPWLNEPDCSGCHDFEVKPDQTASSYNKWTEGPAKLYRMTRDQMDAVMCEACHGSTHAVYPAANPYGVNRDNIQPIQYQNQARSIGGRRELLGVSFG